MNILFSIPIDNKGADDALVSYTHHRLLTIPDSALLGKKRPFFIPDFAARCEARIHLAVRVCRLGRSIDKRFAHRYYDAVAAAVHFTPHPFLERLQAEGAPWSMAYGFDSSLAMGDWCSFPTGECPDTVRLDLLCNGSQAADLNLEGVRGQVDDLLSDASQFYTLRQGDIFLLAGSAPHEVHIDDHLDARLDGATGIAFNVK